MTRSLTRQTLLGMLIVVVTGLAVATVTITVLLQGSMSRSIERNLISEARLVAELLTYDQATTSIDELDGEADAIGRNIASRVTLIAPDGRVLGDSSETPAQIAQLENHGSRPEVLQAGREGSGIARRYSATLRIDMLYVAVPVRHPAVSIVRLALPMSDLQRQLRTVWTSAAAGFLAAFVLALGLAWVTARLLGRRVRAVGAAARRYAAGDFSQPAFDYGEDELGTVARVLDDTARELGQRLNEMARDRARVDAMLAGMVEGVLVMDADGRVQLANDAARRTLALDEPVGRPYRETIRHPEVLRLIADTLARGTSGSLEFVSNRHPDRTFVARTAVVDAGVRAGAVLVTHDVSDLRLADQMRRDFVANVSHELRTPLTAIRGYVEALGDHPADEAERQRFLDVITRHTHRMERLVDDLLRLARLEAGQETRAMERCGLEQIMTDVTIELASTIEAKSQRVEVRVDPAVANIQTDHAKLHDVLRNLVENAVVYAPPNATISLEAVPVGPSLVITVGDEGPGIPPADLTRVFERFYRVDKARSRESGGTGLGLSIVKHLVEVLGGQVTAANRSSGGAVFTVTLPQARDEAP